MLAQGKCYSNASCESFFSSLKRELMPDGSSFESRRDACLALLWHTEDSYNTRRKLSFIAGVVPRAHSNLADN